MTTLKPSTTAVEAFGWAELDEAEQAAAAFLARYSGRTLESYRHDLLTYFRWTNEVGVPVLEATRPHIELYRVALEERGLAPSTIDRRLSTVCGFYRFAHIDGRVTSNPAQYVRRPKVYPAERHGMDRGELGTFLFSAERFDHAHGALAVLLGLNGLRVSEACATNVEDLALERGHRTLRILGKGNKPAVIPLVPRAARTIDRTIEERHEGPILPDPRCKMPAPGPRPLSKVPAQRPIPKMGVIARRLGCRRPRRQRKTFQGTETLSCSHAPPPGGAGFSQPTGVTKST